MTIEAIIHGFFDEDSGCTLFSGCKIKQEGEYIEIQCGFFLNADAERLKKALLEHLQAQGISVANITFLSKIAKHQVQAGLKPLPEVKNIIAVASGKGGVGKSTVSVNLAAALSLQGASVGILDADIYGPSQAVMLGGAQRPETKDGKSMEPIIRHGMQTLSIGDIVEENTAMIWRGPMVTQTLIQLLNECNWKSLDYLIIDLPPGTGDTQLTLSQTIPVTGAIIVTTPQDIALLDVKRAKAMFDKVRIPSLGLVENMSVFHCPNCGHESHIFGNQGGIALAEQYRLPVLAQLPLDMATREHADRGTPIVLAEAQSAAAQNYRRMALRSAWELAQKSKEFSQVFPKIVIER